MTELPPEPRLEFLFVMSLEIEAPDPIGPTSWGDRRVVGVRGGSFDGPKLKGRVLPGGSDWILIRRDGALTQDVRLMLETDDKQHLLMSYRGIRHGPQSVMERLNSGEHVDPSEYYFRTAPIFEAPDGKYDWLNRLIVVASGRRLPDGVTYSVYGVS